MYRYLLKEEDKKVYVIKVSKAYFKPGTMTINQNNWKCYIVLSIHEI